MTLITNFIPDFDKLFFMLHNSVYFIFPANKACKNYFVQV